MKPKLNTNLFSTRPKAVQGRTSLQRIREDLKRRSLRIVLSPVSHYSPFKSPRKSITNFSPRKSILLRRSISPGGSKVANQLIEKLLTPKNKKQRRCTKRKNEAEKLQEELLSKKYISDGNVFGSRRALRSRLILTPKSPLVRVKRNSRQNIASRKISLNSLNKYLNRDVRVELEKLPSDESLENNVSQIEDSESARDNENDQVIRPSRKQIQPREITILLEKLSPSVVRRYTPEETDPVPSTSSIQSEDESFSESSTNDTQTNEVFKKPKHGPILNIRIELEKLPDTDSISVTESSQAESSEEHVEIPHIEDDSISVPETSRVESNEEHGEIPQIEDVSKDISFESLEKVPEIINNTSKDDQSIEESPKEPSTPTRDIVSEQMPISVTPAVISESISAPISTPESGTVENTEMSGKKTPKSLDIPLRRITIVKSKFTKMNRALESPNKASPIKVRPNSTYLSSPLAKSKPSKPNEPSIQDTTNASSLKSSAANIVSSPSPAVENSDESSLSSTSSISSVLSPTLEPAGISSENKSTVAEKVPIKPVYIRKTLLTASNWTYGIGKSTSTSSNKANAEVAKELPKTTSAAAEKTKPTQSVKTPPSVPAAPVCTEVSSPLSRGQLLTAKSLAASPNVPKMIVGKSPSHLAHSSKSSGHKKTAKSPLHRGRLLTEQSLAANQKRQHSGTAEKKIRRSASAGSSVNRSHSNVSSSPKKPQDVSYKQKWLSAGDLLKSLSMDSDSDSNVESSPVAAPLSPAPATGVFSNSKTCAAVLSTLKSGDRDKSKSEPGKLPQWSISDLAKPLDVPSKKTPNSTEIRTQADKSASRSQPDLSQKLAGVQIDSTKKSYAPDSQPTHLPSIRKKPFQIPKVKPGASNFYKMFSASPSNLPRSGFTPSPPTKSTITRPVLDKMYTSNSYPATASYRQPPPKSSQPSSHKTWTKPSTTTSCFKTPTTKPFYSSSSHSSTTKTTYTSITETSSTKLASSSGSNSSTITKTSQISHSLPLTKPSLTSGSILSPFKPPYPVSTHPTAKSPYTSKSHSTTTKPQNSQIPFAKPAPISYTPPNKPPYVSSFPPASHTYQKSSSIPTPTKSNLTTKSLTNSKSKSKSRPFKTAYMSSRSSSTPSYSKCLPSGPQYSPTYSKYLQNGFSGIPTAQYKIPKPARPVSPGTSNVLRWSTVKPWMSSKPKSPPTGPSGSLMSSTLTSNPSYSPLCPNFDP